MLDAAGVIMTIIGEIKDLVKEVWTMVSERKDRKEAILSDMNSLKATLNRCGSVDDAKQINKQYNNFSTPRRARKLLPELVNSIQEYNKWLDESKNVFACETTLIHQRERAKELDQQFVKFKKGDFKSAVTSRIMLYALKGTVSLEQCKENLLENYNRDCKTEDGTDTLIGFCNSQRFYEFVDALKDIQERPPLEVFRDVREHSLKIAERIEMALKK